MRIKLFHVAAMLLCCAAVPVLTASCRDKAAIGETRRLGAEPVSVEHFIARDRLLSEWDREGYRDITLIHVGGYLAFGPVADKTLKERGQTLGSGRKLLYGPVPSGKQRYAHAENYLSVAVAEGIVGKIYWVIPYPFFNAPGGGEQTRQFLIDRELVRDRSDADRWRFAGGCLTGHVHDAEITICAPETMYLIRDPVLLDLDTTFFTEFARTRGISVLETFKIVMEAMFSRGYSVASADAVSSTAAETFDPALIYVASQLREALEDPSIIRQKEPPPLWKARDEGELLLRETDFQQAYAVLTASIREFGPDEGLRALLASAALELDRHDEALAIAGELCGEEDSNCALLLYLGDRTADRGAQDAARPFFEKALALRPGWEPAQTRLAGKR